MDSTEDSSGYDSRETSGLTRDASIFAAAAAAQQHYDALLGELQDGQRQLIAANGLCQKLRKDNLALSDNFEKLKAETLRLKQQLANARQDAARSEEARLEVEREYERRMRTWKSELAQRQREFESLQQSLQPPRDLHLLKIQIQEELEVPYQQRIAELETAVERYRSEAFDYRSKYESLQDEYSGFVDSQGKEAEANQTLLKATRDALQRQIAELHKQLDLHAVDDTPRQLERLKTHLEVSEKQWSDDNTRLRSELLAAKARWQEAAEAHKREVGTLRTQVVKLEAEKLNSDRLYHNTVSEVERLSSKLKEATGKQTTALAAMVAASQAKTQLTVPDGVREERGRPGEEEKRDERMLAAERHIKRLEEQLLTVSQPRPDPYAHSFGGVAPVSGGRFAAQPHGDESDLPDIADDSTDTFRHHVSVPKHASGGYHAELLQRQLADANGEVDSLRKENEGLRAKNKRLHDKVLKFYKHYLDKKSQVDVLKKQIEMLVLSQRVVVPGVDVRGSSGHRSRSQRHRSRHAAGDTPQTTSPVDDAHSPDTK